MTERGRWVVSRKSWHGRLYLLWKTKYATFKNGERRPASSPGSWTEPYAENLCHYCRVVLFWAPLNVFFRRPIERRREDTLPVTPFTVLCMVALALGFVALLIADPLLIGGYLVALAAFAGILMLLAWLVERHKQQQSEGIKRDPTMTNLLIDRLRSKKQKICPLIEVNGE